MFSVIIPLYNKEQYVAQTLRSILDQTYQNFEIIVVDDGSTDNSVAEVRKFHDGRIRIISQQNGGVSVARNRGIAEAKYNLIAFLDADDLWEKDFLETLVKLEQKYPQCSVFALNYTILSYNNTIRPLIINGLPERFQDGIMNNYFQIASKSDPILCASSIMVRKHAIEAIGGFPIGIRAGEDLLTWARLAARFDIAYSIEPKAIFNRLDQEPDTAPRIPDAHDRVADELKKLLLLEDQSRLNGLKSYIAYWHKIRLAIFLRLGKIQEAKKEFQHMSKFAKKDLKFFVYAFLVYAPSSLTPSLNRWVSLLNNYRRKFLPGRSN
jgi:glycosyltransferase involved in cell wall biosynthesis